MYTMSPLQSSGLPHKAVKLVSKSGQASEVSAAYVCHGTIKSLIAEFQSETVAVAHYTTVGGHGSIKVSPRTWTPQEWKSVLLRASKTTYLALSQDAEVQSMLIASPSSVNANIYAPKPPL